MIHNHSAFTELPIEPSDEFDEITWLPLSAKTINGISAHQVRLIHIAIKKLMKEQIIDEPSVKNLLAKTG